MGTTSCERAPRPSEHGVGLRLRLGRRGRLRMKECFASPADLGEPAAVVVLSHSALAMAVLLVDTLVSAPAAVK